MTGSFGNWDGNITDIGPIYPFVGAETLMVIILLIVWVGWHIMQIRMENRTHNEDAHRFRQGDTLQRAMQNEHTLERM